MHAKAQQKYSDAASKAKGRKISRQAFLGLIDSLETSIRKLTWNPGGTEWGDYYENTNYNEDAFNEKKDMISSLLERIKPKTVWDIGANTGVFSKICASKSIPTISFDIDPAAVEKNYLNCIKEGEKSIYPLVLDLTNPSPGLGWHHNERMSLVERSPKDTVMALALIHHLAISNNLPFEKIASLFKDICRCLIIEFVPKEDSQVKRLLATREDIFPNYSQEGFEKSFSGYFSIIEKTQIKQSCRILYLMENNLKD
jgi:ribosomal protein L11 methylase PrmA